MDAQQAQKLKDAIAGCAAPYGIEFAALFGSRATGRVHAKSDTDIAIDSARRLSPHDIASLSQDIAARVGYSAEVVDVRVASPLLLRDAARDGMLLYEKEPGAFERFRVYGYKRFMESKPLREIRRASLDRFLAKTV